MPRKMSPVKVICLFLSTLISALGVTRDPENTAIEFLEKVRAGNIDLQPGGDTALSQQTSEPKRQQIASRLKRMASDFDDGPFEVGNVKIDGELAAAIVRNGVGLDPQNLRVFAVALLKHGESWLAAPVPASFENSGLGFSPPLRKRITELEEWMLHQQITDLEIFRSQALTRMRVKLEHSLPASTLKSWNSRQCVERFLKACESRNLIEFFALSGGHARVLPDDWDSLQRAANAAMASAEPNLNGPWRWLVSKEILRIPLIHEESTDQATFTLGCLDPAGSPPRSTKPKFAQLELKLSKPANGIWQVDLPESFFANSPAMDANDDDEIPDPELLDSFTTLLAEIHPPAPSETAEMARDSLCRALLSNDPSSWVPLVELSETSEKARSTCENAARIWWSTRNPSASIHPVSLGLCEIGDLAAWVIQGFSIRNPDLTDIRIFYFKKTQNGWLWNPEPSAKIQKSFQEWTEQHQHEWQTQWKKFLLDQSIPLDPFPAGDPPTDENARKIVESYIAAVAKGDLMDCIAHTARLNTPASASALLRNLSYEICDAKKSNALVEISKIHPGRVVTTVHISGKSPTPVYPVINTPNGPKILLEFDFALMGGRSRDFLNNESLDRLRKSSPAAADDLKTRISRTQD